MPCGWEGIRKSGVELAMRHSPTRDHGLRKKVNIIYKRAQW